MEASGQVEWLSDLWIPLLVTIVGGIAVEVIAKKGLPERPDPRSINPNLSISPVISTGATSSSPQNSSAAGSQANTQTVNVQIGDNYYDPVIGAAQAAAPSLSRYYTRVRLALFTIAAAALLPLVGPTVILYLDFVLVITWTASILLSIWSVMLLRASRRAWWFVPAPAGCTAFLALVTAGCTTFYWLATSHVLVANKATLWNLFDSIQYLRFDKKWLTITDLASSALVDDRVGLMIQLLGLAYITMLITFLLMQVSYWFTALKSPLPAAGQRLADRRALRTLNFEAFRWKQLMIGLGIAALACATIVATTI